MCRSLVGAVLSVAYCVDAVECSRIVRPWGRLCAQHYDGGNLHTGILRARGYVVISVAQTQYAHIGEGASGHGPSRHEHACW